jgi:myo-inositol-1(or 4)-monophosphatase
MPTFLGVCEQAVRAAGAVLVEKWGKVEAREKGQFDLVTEADLAAQEVVRRTVLESYPDHAFLGEEDEVGQVPPASNTEYRWIVDPLDGTTNYVHGVPHFSVSLALERAGELLIGAIFHPVANECFTAVAGEGTRLNGAAVRASRVATLSGALGSVGFPAVVRDDSPDLQVFLKAVNVCQAIRRTGSAALNLAYVAAGRFDLAWSFCSKSWDVAAGVLMIRESGGVVTAPDGGEFDLDHPAFIAAANRPLHGELRKLVAAV